MTQQRVYLRKRDVCVMRQYPSIVIALCYPDQYGVYISIRITNSRHVGLPIFCWQTAQRVKLRASITLVGRSTLTFAVITRKKPAYVALYQLPQSIDFIVTDSNNNYSVACSLAALAICQTRLLLSCEKNFQFPTSDFLGLPRAATQ